MLADSSGHVGKSQLFWPPVKVNFSATHNLPLYLEVTGFPALFNTEHLPETYDMTLIKSSSKLILTIAATGEVKKDSE